jgi:transposase
MILVTVTFQLHIQDRFLQPLLRPASAAMVRRPHFPNTVEGIAALAAFCQAHQIDLVAMEATGGYEKQAQAQLSNRACRWLSLTRVRYAGSPTTWGKSRRPIGWTQA